MENAEIQTEPAIRKPRAKLREVMIGVGCVAIGHLIVFLSRGVVVYYIGAFYFIGIFQLAYVIPLALIFSNKGRKGIAQGVWIAAIITFLMNATCFGIFAFTYRP